MRTASCQDCDADVPRTARWCGACGARLQVHRAAPDRRRTAIVTGAVLLVVGLVAGAVALVGGGTTTDAAAPDETPTIVDTACNLDDEAPSCVSWTLPAGTPGSVVADEVIVIGRGGDVVGTDAATGEERWRTTVTTEVQGFGAVPLMTADGIVVVNAQLGGVHGIDPVDGTRLWSVDGGAALPAANPGVIVVRTQTGFVRGVTPLDGEVRWERRLDDRVYPDVEVHGDLVTALRPGGLQVFDRATGTPLWAANDELIDVHGVTPDGLVVSFAPSPLRAAGRLAVYDVTEGTVRWTRARAAGQEVTVSRDAMFVQATNTPLERLAVRDGTSEWVVGGVDLVDVPLGPTILDRGVPVMSDRWLQLLDPATGELLQESRVGRNGITQLAIAGDGELVATTPDGLHRFPENGPTRAELDAIAATVLTASPLLVEVGGRLVRVEDVDAPTTPRCTVGLRRARCEAWRLPIDDDAVVVTDGVVVTVQSGALRATDLASGEEVWRRRVDDDPTLRPVVGSGSVVVVASGRRTLGVDVATGDVRWTDDGRVVAVDGLGDDEVAVARDGVVEILDVGTGGATRLTVTVPIGAELVGVTDTSAILVTRDRDVPSVLSAVDLTTGEATFSRPLPDQQVHVTPTALYLAPHDDGGVFRHDPVTGALTWGSPQGQLVWSAASGDEPWLVTQEVGIDNALVTTLERDIGATIWTRTSAPVRGWRADRSRTVFATADGIEVVDRGGDPVWEAVVQAPTIVHASPLVVVSGDEVLRFDDPS